ncbi:High-affinity methionine permease [Pseudohyphozyma bogoriensis]|nr:High-affinity methionine permease [Pseudohyphozyma bogoriensis]
MATQVGSKVHRGSISDKSASDVSISEEKVSSSPEAGTAYGLEPSASNPGGAPTEATSALGGGNVGWFSVIFLQINMIIGTGIFSTSGSLLQSLGSPGIVLLFWVLGLVIALSALAVYLELVHIFPKRAGAEVVYLEQAYPKPKYLFPAAFAFLSVVLSFASSNAIVLSTYLLYAAGNDNPSEWLERGVAVAGYTVASLFVLFSTKWVLRLNNLLGVLKLIMLCFVVVTGWVVLSGKTHIKDPTAAFRDPFAGTLKSGNAIANAIIRLNFSFGGYYNALNVANEIKGKDPLKTLRWTTPLSVIVVGILYIFATIRARVLPALVAVSAFGNLVAVLIGQTRIVREIGRQGVLPYPKVWTSTWPFGTPAMAIFFTWIVTAIMIVAPPAGDAFNFVVDLQSYPNNVFTAMSFIGVYLIRLQRKKAGLPPAQFQAWHAAILFRVAISVLLLVMPWVPPTGGIYAGDVSFFYATYCFVGLGIMAACAVYWYIWVKLLPRYRGYKIVDKTVYEADGTSYNKLTKVWNDGRMTD